MDTAGARVLIVDDDASSRRLLEVRLRALGCDVALAANGREGEIYNIGGSFSCENLHVAREILRLTGKPESLLKTVVDRPGHDRRYALSSAKIERELGWSPSVDFSTGLARTIDWYRSHRSWVSRVKGGDYRQYYQQHYQDREQTLSRL